MPSNFSFCPDALPTYCQSTGQNTAGRLGAYAVNKVLLEHGHARLFTPGLWLLHATAAELSGGKQTPRAPKA